MYSRMFKKNKKSIGFLSVYLPLHVFLLLKLARNNLLVSVTRSVSSMASNGKALPPVTANYQHMRYPGLIILFFFAFNLVFCVVGVQAYVVYFHIPLLITGVFAIVTSFIRLPVFVYLLVIIAALTLAFEVGIVVTRFIVWGVLCDEHQGCLSASLAYIIMTVCSLFLFMPLIIIFAIAVAQAGQEVQRLRRV